MGENPQSGQSVLDRMATEAAAARSTTDLNKLASALRILKIREEGASPAVTGAEQALVSALLDDPEWRKSVEAKIAATT